MAWLIRMGGPLSDASIDNSIPVPGRTCMALDIWQPQSERLCRIPFPDTTLMELKEL